MGAKADLPSPETSRLQSDYKDPSSKTPIATLIIWQMIRVPFRALATPYRQSS
jgi:hypothetical protein